MSRKFGSVLILFCAKAFGFDQRVANQYRIARARVIAVVNARGHIADYRRLVGAWGKQLVTELKLGYGLGVGAALSFDTGGAHGLGTEIDYLGVAVISDIEFAVTRGAFEIFHNKTGFSFCFCTDY